MCTVAAGLLCREVAVQEKGAGTILQFPPEGTCHASVISASTNLKLEKLGKKL
jgi:hypothetical protein